MRALHADTRFAEVAIDVERRQDGLILKNKIELGSYPETVLAPLQRWARTQPNAPFLRERAGEGWGEITYGAFLDRVAQRAPRVLALGCDPHKPLLILSPNSIEHAITSFAAMMAGVPAAVVSPAYGTASSLERLRQIVSVLQPGGIYVGDSSTFSRVLAEFGDGYLPIVSAASAGGAMAFDDVAPVDANVVQAAHARIHADTIAKILFTSGSTGAPKGVINTHRMICSNQIALGMLWPLLRQTPPTLVDWLPWSHTFGGNVCLNLTLFNGGVMHIDDGKPSPALIGRTVENIKGARPNLYFNVPAGYEALLPCLENDEAFARAFFSSTQMLFVAGAALPQRAHERLSALALKATGRAPTLLAGWGSTETAPFATAVYFPTESAANIGLPMPGTAIKMVRREDKLALLVKGPNVTPGYWNNAEATRAAFDAEGFYDMGDAGRLLDPDVPEKGIAFDGRLSENFKLTSGTWVNVGMLRVALVDLLRPLCVDVVITGENREDVGALLVPNFAHAAELSGTHADTLTPQVLAACAFGEKILAAIRDHNARQSGASTRIARAAILARAPDLNRSEITDKGYLNQRAMITNHIDVVTGMYGDGAPGVLRI